MGARFCTQCGAELAPKARFCTNCGAKVKARTAQSQKKPRSRKRQRSQRQLVLTPTILVVGGGVLLFLVGALILLSLNRPGPEPASSAAADVHDEQGIPYPEVPRIALSEAKARFDAGTAIFVDVRTQGEYETAHIPNAILLPLADLEARYQELPKDAEIITYCT